MSGSSIAAPAGIVIFCSSNCVRTLSATKLLAHVSRPPETKSTIAMMRPVQEMSLSSTLRMMTTLRLSL